LTRHNFSKKKIKIKNPNLLESFLNITYFLPRERLITYFCNFIVQYIVYKSIEPPVLVTVSRSENQRSK